jgi:cytochrome c-type biogenesis protein CcsB
VRKAVVTLLILLWVLHTGAIGLRWVESYQQGIGHATLSNLYESMIFFGWATALALILTRLKFEADLVMLHGLPAVFLIMASTFLMDKEIKPLIPALQSNWLVAHVITCFLGYSGFAISFLAALVLIALHAADSSGTHRHHLDIIDQVVYRSILVGFPMLTIGIITGAVWADYAWGSYWSWDPKETWSLITWFVYAGFLHARLTRDWSGRRTAFLSLLGFAAVMFTYFGVNYLPGLHSYF